MSDDLLTRLEEIVVDPHRHHSLDYSLHLHARSATEIRRLNAELEGARLERDMARDMFDRHVVWASEQADIAESALRAAQALATCCMSPGCYSHDELVEAARATRPTFDAALGRISGEGE